MNTRITILPQKTATGQEGKEKELLHRDSPFSYTCRQCNRCCINKIIKLNPYEVARLSANRGISTTEFIRTFTFAHGTVLKMTPQGECIFRSRNGCAVHPDRPLVCRLYPLGRHVSANGEERFSLLPPHPQSEGVFGHDGTVEDYLISQGAGPYIDSVERYLHVLGRILSQLQAGRTSDTEESPAAPNGSVEHVDPGVQTGLEWLDMDPAVSTYCARHGMQVSSEPDKKMAVHITAIEELIAILTKGDLL